MGHLLLNSLAVHRSRTLRDLKKEHPDQANLLVSKHNPGERVTVQKQATGTQTKKIVSKMLTICSLSEPANKKGIKQATGIQKSSEQNAHYLLTIQNQAQTMSTRSIPSSTSHASSTTGSSKDLHPCGYPIHPRPFHDHGAPQGAAASHSKGRGGGGAVWGPLRLPWGGVGPLARPTPTCITLSLTLFRARQAHTYLRLS
jgi:hypothetical protein